MDRRKSSSSQFGVAVEDADRERVAREAEEKRDPVMLQPAEDTESEYEFYSIKVQP